MKRELRTCPVTGRTVLLNEAWPPLPPPARTSPADECWFCQPRGPMISQHGSIVAIPHPTPALGIEGQVRPRREPAGVVRDAVGAHELLYGTHEEGDESLLRLAAQRIVDLRRDVRLRGFSLQREGFAGEHRAWHLVALPFHLAPHPTAAYRDAERAEAARMVARTHEALAVAAFAPTAPFETWIFPLSANVEFGDNPTLSAVCSLAHRVGTTLASTLGNPVIRWSVREGAPWHLVLQPQLRCEAPPLPDELPLVGVFPERAAKVLRGG